jgi:hypothetical protein
MPEVDSAASFTLFVYPFLFEQETFSSRARAADCVEWPGRRRHLPVWTALSFPEEDVLAHVARYLNPPADTPPTARLWGLQNDALQSPSGLGASANWSLTLPRLAGQERELPIHFESVRLMLFGTGVGFLTICAKPQTREIADWLNFNHYFRFVRGQRGVGIRAERRTGLGQLEPFFPEPVGHAVPRQSQGQSQETVDVVLGYLLDTVKVSGETTHWWREVFVPGQLMPFTVLYGDGLTDADMPDLVYRARNFFHGRQEIQPSVEDLELDAHPRLLRYADKAWFTFSLDGGLFLVCDAPTGTASNFWRGTLPWHLQEEYFLLFLLAMHQRFALMGLTEDVARHWVVGEQAGAPEEREAAFERIRDGLLVFTARGYFAQVMQREHHHRVYRRWQETFQVERLYREVSDEVEKMAEYLLLRRTERLQKTAKLLDDRLTFLGWLVTSAALGLTFVQAIGGAPWWIALLVGLLGWTIGAVAFWIVRRLSKRS